jgi:hypothetical protein
MSATSETPRWFTSRRFVTTSIIVLCAILTVEAVIAIGFRDNDYLCHVTFGQEFLAGDPYASDGNYYLLGRLGADAVFALLPYYVGRAICFALGVASLGISIYLWTRMAQAHDPVPPSRIWPTIVLTLVVLLAFLLRDLDECGLQLMLLGMLSAGVWSLWKKQSLLAGLWFAAGASFKSTPLLFLPFLIWKREWKAATAMALGLMLLNFALPAAYLGPQATVVAVRDWADRMAQIAHDQPEAHPSIHPIEPAKVQNQGLQAVIARYIESYPPGHSLHMEHPLYFQFGALPYEQSKTVLKLMILALGVVVAWQFRRSWRSAEGRGHILTECAVAIVFAAMLSPLVWKQHLVVALPCVLLVARSFVTRPDQPRWRLVAFTTIAAIFLLTRHGIIGRDLSLLLMNYKIDGIAVLALVGLTMTLPRSPAAVQAAAPPQTEALSKTHVRHAA